MEDMYLVKFEGKEITFKNGDYLYHFFNCYETTDKSDKGERSP